MFQTNKHYTDDEAILPDGQRLRVPLTMMDSVQRAVASAEKAGRPAYSDSAQVTDAFGKADAFALGRPGPRYQQLAPKHSTQAAVQATLDVVKRDAYAE